MERTLVLLVGLVFTLVPAAARGQQPAHLVKDINPGVDRAQGLFPDRLTPFSGELYFQGFDDFHGPEVWKTDGTAAGTRLVIDLFPGWEGAGFYGAAGDYLYLVTQTYPAQKLWVSDGTITGTRSLITLPSISPVGTLGTLFFFQAWTPETGWEPWVSNGTPGGTHVVELVPGSNDARAQNFIIAGTLAYFEATVNGVPGLWRTDGTQGGTFRLSDRVYLRETATIGNRLFFIGCDNVSGCEPWTSDGTAGGTRRIADLVPGPGSSSPHSFAAAVDTVYFGAQSSGVFGLWKTDAAGAGATFVAPANVQPDFWEDSSAVVGGVLFFVSFDTTQHYTLWRSDGTEEGTRMVADLPEPSEGSFGFSFGSFTAAGNLALFTISDFENGTRDLWRSDGSAAGTYRLRTEENLFFGGPLRLVPALGRVFFASGTQDSGRELWSTDGTVPGTGMVLDFAPAANAWPWRLAAMGRDVVFLADSHLSPTGAGFGQPWTSDGTEAGTVMLTDRIARLQGMAINHFVPGNGRTFFTASVPGTGLELWSTDGTDAGTFRLAGEMTSLFQRDPVNTLYFARFRAPAFTWEVWKSDGTPAGTVFVKAFDSRDVPGDFQEIDGLVYFRGCTSSHGCEPWVTDGTEAGTREIADVVPGNAASHPHSFTSANGSVFFMEAYSRRLWKTDGTAMGTVLVRQFERHPYGLTTIGNRIVFGIAHLDPLQRDELWSSDGTAEGTQVLDTFIGSYNAGIGPFVRLGDLVLFGADDGVHGRELWRTDGTEQGTALITDLHAVQGGFDNPGFGNFAVAGLRVVFTAVDVQHGREVFATDGTAAGTRVLTDINPGPDSSNPYELVVAGPNLFVAAGRPDVGFELWTVVLSPATAIDDLAQYLDGLGVHAGTVQSLKAKLQAAQRALERGQTATAASLLEAFINEVQAQSGKKIPEAEAAALIDRARRIVESL